MRQDSTFTGNKYLVGFESSGLFAYLKDPAIKNHYYLSYTSTLYIDYYLHTNIAVGLLVGNRVRWSDIKSYRTLWHAGAFARVILTRFEKSNGTLIKRLTPYLQANYMRTNYYPSTNIIDEVAISPAFSNTVLVGRLG